MALLLGISCQFVLTRIAEMKMKLKFAVEGVFPACKYFRLRDETPSG